MASVWTASEFRLEGDNAASDLTAIKVAGGGGGPCDATDTIYCNYNSAGGTFTVDEDLTCAELQTSNHSTAYWGYIIINDGVVLQTAKLASRGEGSQVVANGTLVSIGVSVGTADQAFDQNLDAYNRAVYVPDDDGNMEAWYYVDDLDDVDVAPTDKVYMVNDDGAGIKVIFGDGAGGGAVSGGVMRDMFT